MSFFSPVPAHRIAADTRLLTPYFSVRGREPDGEGGHEGSLASLASL